MKLTLYILVGLIVALVGILALYFTGGGGDRRSASISWTCKRR
jgi:hypothetical protein